MSEFDRPQWLADARTLLDESARDLDAATLSRLNRARQAALRVPRRRRAPVRWLPVTALAGAGALLLAAAVWRLPPHAAAPSPPAQAVAADDADASGEDNLDLYQNLEFYAWLDAQERDGDG